MKTPLTISLLFAIWATAQSQNLIRNHSFETPNITGDCPTGLAQFEKVKDWTSRTQTVSSSTSSGTSAIHSPDWLSTLSGCRNFDPFMNSVLPTTGNFLVYFTPEELIQQDLQNALNEGLYYFKANVKLFSAPGSSSFGLYEYNSSYKYYLRVRLSKTEVSYHSENSDIDAVSCAANYRKIHATKPITYLAPILTANADSWQQVTIDPIKIFEFGYDWIAIDLVVYDQSDVEIPCASIGVQLDDVELYRDCCGDYMLYQDISDKLPNNTQRRLFIRAGSDVGAPNMSTGPVIVKSNRKIKFRAGGFIDIQPGFVVEPGGVFVAEIAPCGAVDDPAYDFGLNIDYANQCAFLNCSAPYYPPTPTNCFGTNMAFYSYGAGWYHVMIKNSSGAIIFEDIQSINSPITQYWNGYPFAYFTQSQHIATVDLAIYNCMGMQVKTFTVTYEYLSGCGPNAKTDWQEMITNSIEPCKVLVAPNPTDGKIEVLGSSREVTEEIKSGLDYKIYNANSALVSAGKTFGDISLEELPGGIYYVFLFTTCTNYLSFKILKQ